MEEKVNRPYRLVEVKEGRNRVVKLLQYQEITVNDSAGNAVKLAGETVADQGIHAEMNGNFVVVQYSRKLFRLYCYHQGMLNKGPVCRRYMQHNGRFVYQDEDKNWWTAKHNCRGYVPLGVYHGRGIWILKKKDGYQLTTYLDSKLNGLSFDQPRVRQYRTMSKKVVNPFVFFIFKDEEERTDVLFVNHNDIVFYYDDISSERVEKLLAKEGSAFEGGYCDDHWERNFRRYKIKG